MSVRTAAPERASALSLLPLGRLLAWLGITVLVLYMTVGEGSGWYGVYSVDLRIFSLCCLVGVFTVWALTALRWPVWRPRSVLWPVTVAILAAFMVSTVTSWNPRISLEYLAYTVLLAGLYLLLVRLIASPFFGPRVYMGAALLTAGIAIWYLWTVLGIWARWWDLVGRIALPPLRPSMDGLDWRSPNTVAIMLILLLPPVLAWFGWSGQRRRTALCALGAVVLAAVVITGSRGAWLGLGVGSVVTACAWLVAPSNRASIRRLAARTPLGRAGLAAVGFVVAALAVVATPVVASRLGGGGEDLRASLFGNALRQFATAPLSGTGPGTWVVRRIAFTDPSEQDYYIPHAHNVFLQALSEFGVIGVLAGVILVIWLGALIWDGAREPDARRRRFAWASLFTTIYFAAHQLVDLYVGLPCVLFAWGLSVAYLDATSRQPLFRGLRQHLAGSSWIRWRHGGQAGSGALAAGIVLAIGFLAWSEANALPADRAVGSANAGDWSEARVSADAAATGDHAIAGYAFIAGLAAINTGDPATAAADFSYSAATDDFPQAWLDLAASRDALGDAPGTRDALTRAMRVGRQQPSVAFAAGSLYQRLGDRQAAVDAYAAAIRVAPTLASDPWFAAGGTAADLRADVMAAVKATWGPDEWEAALLTGDAGGAATRAALVGGHAGDQARMIISAWSGDAAALAQVEAAASASPLDLNLVAWTARVLRQNGAGAAADRYREWADIVAPGSGNLALDARTTTGEGSLHGFGGVDPNVYGLYTYRRPMPVELLAPGLPRIVLE